MGYLAIVDWRWFEEVVNTNKRTSRESQREKRDEICLASKCVDQVVICYVT